MELIVIQKKIYELRGHKVMLDFDLAALYEVEARVLNQAVKRNIERFPTDFMFRLTTIEWESISSQFVMRSSSKRPKSALPYAFTEHGVTMLASVLKSGKAIQMNITIVRAFIALKQYKVKYKDLEKQITEIRDRVGGHDAQLNQIYEAIENLLDYKVERETWRERERIGYR